MNAATLRFVVLGTPETKGSTRSFVPMKWAREAVQRERATGKAVPPRAITTNDNPKAKAWQQLIATHASLALRDANLQPFMDGAIVLDVWFYFARPQKFLTKKYAGIDVPHITVPDADKALRVVKDALSDVVYRNDSMVIDAYVHKRYCAAGEMPRAEITIRSVQWDLPKPIHHPETPLLFGEETLYGEAQQAR
jgi:Holliday junction resolvase RusA-like endonuclease